MKKPEFQSKFSEF